MVGDNYTDIVSGRNAGMKTVFCNFGFGSLNGEPYDFAVDSFTELVDKLCSSAG